MIHKKAYQRRAADEFGIEQTRDPAVVRSILEAAGLIAEGVEAPSSCYLIAYRGNQPIGAVGIESRIDAAMLRSLAVAAPMRRRGIGEALVKAARIAAHTRGARTLYTLTSEPLAGWFARLGFAMVPISKLTTALSGTFLLNYLAANYPHRFEQMTGMALDIANDGVIER
jgi:amino-acid N-acetyltransferase